MGRPADNWSGAAGTGATGAMDNVADAGESDGAGCTCRRGNDDGEAAVGEAEAGDGTAGGARVCKDGEGRAAADGERPADDR